MRPLGRGGLSVGPLSFGTAPIGNLGRRVDEDEWRGALARPGSAGVRYFDTAPHYGLGLAERRLAEGLAARARRVHRLDQGRAAARADVARTRWTRGLRRPRHARARARLQPRRRARLAGVQPRAARARPRRPPARPRSRRATTARRSTGRSRRWRSCARRASSRPTARGMNQAEMLADFVRETDLDVVMLAGRYTLLEQGALDDLLPRVPAARRVGDRGGRVQLRPARARPPARGRHVQLRARAAGAGRARAPHRRRPGAPRHEPARRRGAVPAGPSRRRDRLPRRALRRAGAAQRRAVRRSRSRTRPGASSSPRGCCAPTLRFRPGETPDDRGATTM